MFRKSARRSPGSPGIGRSLSQSTFHRIVAVLIGMIGAVICVVGLASGGLWLLLCVPGMLLLGIADRLLSPARRSPL